MTAAIAGDRPLVLDRVEELEDVPIRRIEHLMSRGPLAPRTPTTVLAAIRSVAKSQ